VELIFYLLEDSLPSLPRKGFDVDWNSQIPEVFPIHREGELEDVENSCHCSSFYIPGMDLALNFFNEAS
jgi:hypothetical protein